MSNLCQGHDKGSPDGVCPVCLMGKEKEEIRTALIMVLGSELMERDGHDWRTCEQPSCVIARRYVPGGSVKEKSE